jgi:predicted CopG family antitoxin
MVQNEVTTVKVKRETHAQLKALKDDDRTSFDTVISSLLESGDTGGKPCE